ncbi:hypothetical protein ACWDTI_17570 [Gordonia sp. NPDC003424]
MKRTSIAAVLLSAAAIAAVAAPASAGPLGDLFGSSGSADSGSSDLLDSGSAALGSSSDKPKHYGKLGRADAPNGVKSINTWVYAPNAQPTSTNTYPKNSQLGVRWNSTIDSGPVVDGNECKIEVRISGPKIPAKAQVFKTEDCTSVKSYMLRTPGSYAISVTDLISGASNSITFDVA